MEQTEDFNADPFFNDASLQQIDASGIDALNAVPLPSSPSVIERILTLQACGCLNRVAWSRGGHIARIAEDGASVELHCLIFDPSSCSWALGLKHIEQLGLGELNSLVWSPAGFDLAVVDVKGRLSILRPQNMALNRYVQVRSGLNDEPDELSQVVGMYWLPQDRPGQVKTAVQHASKVDHKWTHHPARTMPLGPLSKRAVVLVDRRGRLSVVFEKSESNSELIKLTTPLVAENHPLFTHAAFSPTVEGKLLVALHSYEGVLSTVFVKISFPASPEAKGTLTVEPGADKLPSTSGNVLINGQAYSPDSHVLTHLGIIPTSEHEKATHSPPTVFGIYAKINKNGSATDLGFLMGSAIRRWTISSVEQPLHSRFDELPTKAKDSIQYITTSAQRLPEKEEQLITSAFLTDCGQQALAITTQDGRTDFLSSEDLSSVSYQASLSEASSLPQSGFSFPVISAPSYLSLSPNSCVKVIIDGSDKLEVTTMDFPSSSDDLSSPAIDAATAAIVISLSRAIWGNANIDDLLSVVLSTFNAPFAITLTIHLYRTLFKESEFINDRNRGNDLEKVVQKPVITKVFAFHYMISFLSLKNSPSLSLSKSPKSPTLNLSLSGQWAWIVANLRFVAYLLHSMNRDIINPQANLTQELVDIICGNLKWTLDLLRYIVAKILEVEDREMNPDFFPKPAEGEVHDGSQGLVPLLLNCHWSRQFFVATVRVMTMLARLPEPRSRLQMQILRTIAEGSQGKGLGLVAIEQLLAAAWSALGDVGEMSEQAGRQVEMMATGVVTGGYRGTVKRLLHRGFGVEGGLRKEGVGKQGVDRLKLWEDKVDEGWLMLDGGMGGRRYDVHKKKVIVKGVREGEGEALMIKRCVRCGRFSEDVNGIGVPGQVSKYVNILMIKCVCDGSWVIEPWEK